MALNPADVLKIFYLQAHYSRPIDFTWEKMEEAKKAYEHIDILMNKLEKKYGVRDIIKAVKPGAEAMQQYKDKFIEYMDDDFNMPRALGVLFEMIRESNKTYDSNDEYKDFILNYAMSVIKEMADIFNLTFVNASSSGMSDVKVKAAILLREQRRKEKKYKEADDIRKTLEEKGVILEDTREGTTWRRKA